MAGKLSSSFWLEAIGVVVGGYSLFSLSQSLFEFGLSDVFGSVTDIYRSTFHPIIGVTEPPIKWIVERAGFSLPVVWRDFAVFYLVVAGAVARVHSRPNGRLSGVLKLVIATFHGLTWILVLLLFPLMLIVNRNAGAAARNTLSHYKDVFIQIAFAGGALAAFLALNAYGY